MDPVLCSSWIQISPRILTCEAEAAACRREVPGSLEARLRRLLLWRPRRKAVASAHHVLPAVRVPDGVKRLWTQTQAITCQWYRLRVWCVKARWLRCTAVWRWFQCHISLGRGVGVCEAATCEAREECRCISLCCVVSAAHVPLGSDNSMPVIQGVGLWDSFVRVCLGPSSRQEDEWAG